MTQTGFEPIVASQRLQAAGLPAEQAEAVVETVSEVNVLTQQVADDLSDLKSYIQENMVTRDDLKDFVTREMLTADLAVLKSEIFRLGFIATGILATLILGLASMFAAMSVAALWR